MSARHDDFYIGWADRLPPGGGGFLGKVAGGFLIGLLLLSLGLARTMDDSGAGVPGGEVTLRGTLTGLPYALLHVAPNAAHPQGHAVMLAAVGKFPVVVAPDFEGRVVDVKGWLVRRGALEMVQMTGEPVRVDAPPALPTVEKLGRWRLTGEICDGQCFAGLMRPGTGIAHRACANFCLVGGVPPVFVTTAPIAGTSFLVMADAAGGAVGKAMYDYTGLRVRLDGEVERRGDVLVFRADFGSAVVP